VANGFLLFIALQKTLEKQLFGCGLVTEGRNQAYK
jgi:hypothetical protein